MMGSDGRAGEGSSRNQQLSSGFQWFSPSPSPEEIERLEFAFPEIVCFPGDALAAEREAWKASAVVARSYSKWVPADAYVREFRRAGVKGAISPISLAHRCYVFRFEEGSARELVLNRPWTVNGQVIAMEPWVPEFFPEADAIPLAMVWVRLPGLPLEFWTVDFLRKITEAAGEFVCADASTVARSRGGFARVCIKVDLRGPLRPGIRIDGIERPFWQRFAYEQLDGICCCCGTIHLGGPCSQSEGAGVDEAEIRPLFGPWIAALRRRREVSEIHSAKGKQQVSQSMGGAAGSGGLGTGKGLRSQGKPDAEGWIAPSKIARRGKTSSLQAGEVSMKQGASSVVLCSQGSPGNQTVPVENISAGTVHPKKSIIEAESEDVLNSDSGQLM